MAKLSLKDIAALAEDRNKMSDLPNNPDMQDYVNEMQEVGMEVFKNLSEEELAVVVSFMQAMFSYQLTLDEPMLAMMFLGKIKETSLPMAQALKFAVGVVLSEDWR